MRRQNVSEIAEESFAGKVTWEGERQVKKEAS